MRQLKLQALKQDITLGIEQANRGKLISGDEVFEKLRRICLLLNGLSYCPLELLPVNDNIPQAFQQDRIGCGGRI